MPMHKLRLFCLIIFLSLAVFPTVVLAAESYNKNELKDMSNSLLQNPAAHLATAPGEGLSGEKVSWFEKIAKAASKSEDSISSLLATDEDKKAAYAEMVKLLRVIRKEMASEKMEPVQPNKTQPMASLRNMVGDALDIYTDETKWERAKNGTNTAEKQGNWEYDAITDSMSLYSTTLNLSSVSKADAELVLRYIYLVNHVLQIETKLCLATYHSFIAKLDKKWKAYFNQTLSQFPYEMLLNNSIYKKYRSNISFNEPPTSQLVLIHPTTFFEYVGSDIKANSLVIEWIGYNTWKWDEEGNIEYSTLLIPGLSGVALITDYSDYSDVGVTDWGYGILFHYKSSTAIGVTKHDNRYGLLVNFDLNKFLLEHNEQKKDKFRLMIP